MATLSFTTQQGHKKKIGIKPAGENILGMKQFEVTILESTSPLNTVGQVAFLSEVELLNLLTLQDPS